MLGSPPIKEHNKHGTTDGFNILLIRGSYSCHRGHTTEDEQCHGYATHHRKTNKVTISTKI